MAASMGPFALVLTAALVLGVNECRAQVIGSDLLVARGQGGPPSSSILRISGLTGANLGPFTFGGSLDSYSYFNYGPNGNLFVTSMFSGRIQEFNGVTGAFVRNVLSTPPTGGGGYFTFGPDGNIYREEPGSVAMPIPLMINRYNTSTGQLIDTFVPTAMSGYAFGGGRLIFAPSGNLYASDHNRILRFDGTTGAPLTPFTLGPASTFFAADYLFRSNGNILASDFNGNQILQYDGVTGAPLGVFATGSGLTEPYGMTLGPDNLLYVTSFDQYKIYRYNGTTGAFVDIFSTLPVVLPPPSYIGFTLTIVPEPTSWILVGLFAVGAVARRIPRKAPQEGNSEDN